MGLKCYSNPRLPKEWKQVYMFVIQVTHLTLLLQTNQWAEKLQNRFTLDAVCALGGSCKRHIVAHGDGQKSSLYNAFSELFWFSCPPKAAELRSAGSVQVTVPGMDCAGPESLLWPEPQQRWWWKCIDVLQQQEDRWQMHTAQPGTAVEWGTQAETGVMEVPWRHHLYEDENIHETSVLFMTI